MEISTVGARAAILAKVRQAVKGSEKNDWEGIPRGFRQGSTASAEEVRERLVDRLHDYDAQVLECRAGEEREAVARMLGTRGVTRMVVPVGLRRGLLPEGFGFVVDEELSYAELNGCDGILTESTLAIAETGTIVLQNVAGQGRRAATLVPDYHLCVVRAADVVATVPEAIARLRATAELPTTFISGPSATADIEMTRIKGVHGPRFLDVVLVV
jgi:L-lactate dehydrogenase complex protein LldG